MSQFASRFAVPVGIALVAANSSLVSVYGGQRAIIFDRFQGVKPQVSFFSLSLSSPAFLLASHSILLIADSF